MGLNEAEELLLAVADERLKLQPVARKLFALEHTSSIRAAPIAAAAALAYASNPEKAALEYVDSWLAGHPEVEPIKPPQAPEQPSGKRWTAGRLAELRAYREAHKMKATAEHFGVSPQRVRQLLSRDKPAPCSFSVFQHKTK